jgi:hypothetical protein
MRSSAKVVLAPVRGVQRGGWAVHAVAKRLLFDWYPLLALGGMAGVGWLAVAAAHHRLGGDGGELTIGAAGVVAGFVYFVQQQRLTELTVQYQLFAAFNARYDALDAALNRIVEDGDGTAAANFTPEEREHLYRYFNLCAEEHFFFTQGLVHPTVWETWLAGMRWYYGRSERVRRLWAYELDRQHYYEMPRRLFETDEGEDRVG